MSEKQVVLVTGAGRGMGVDIARAALAAGHRVVATARDAERVVQALGSSADLLAVSLDITDPASTQAAVTAAVDRFGRLDVLINNAGNFYAGFFEEITPDAFRAQVETNLFGPLTVTRAVLPVMRAQRSGIVVTISSTAGLIGGEFASAYAASKPRSRISWNPSHPGHLGGAAGAPGSRRRRRRRCGAEGQGSTGAGRRPPRAVQLAVARRRLSDTGC